VSWAAWVVDSESRRVVGGSLAGGCESNGRSQLGVDNDHRDLNRSSRCRNKKQRFGNALDMRMGDTCGLSIGSGKQTLKKVKLNGETDTQL
jgi:hypothetical protein